MRLLSLSNSTECNKDVPVIGWRERRALPSSRRQGAAFLRILRGSLSTKRRSDAELLLQRPPLLSTVICGRVKPTPQTLYRAREGNQSKLQRGTKETNSEYNQRPRRGGWTAGERALINPLLPVALGFFFFFFLIGRKKEFRVFVAM